MLRAMACLTIFWRRPVTDPARIEVDIASQRLTYLNKNDIRIFAVSTAANGVGEKNGSHCTPRGRHIIRALIGGDAEPNTVFVGRRPTGETYRPEMREQFPGRDWILTRILWLSGREPGFNRLGDVDTMRRYVYIHGAPDDVEMGKPGSHGCIRMRNSDLITLYDLAETGMEVLING